MEKGGAAAYGWAPEQSLTLTYLPGELLLVTNPTQEKPLPLLWPFPFPSPSVVTTTIVRMRAPTSPLTFRALLQINELGSMWEEELPGQKSLGPLSQLPSLFYRPVHLSSLCFLGWKFAFGFFSWVN